MNECARQHYRLPDCTARLRDLPPRTTAVSKSIHSPPEKKSALTNSSALSMDDSLVTTFPSLASGIFLLSCLEHDWCD